MRARYKAMLELSADERRGLNTFAAIHSTTPSRYVGAALRERLERDAEQFGLSIGPAGANEPLDGQLAIEVEPASPAPAPARKRARKAQEDSGPTRRTRK